jgi:hypothetical protein
VSEAAPGKLRVRAGLGFVQFLRPALYALLVASAFFTFWAGGDIAGHGLPHWMQVVAPTLFAIFLVIFAFYRFALVRARKYPAAIGFFQVGLGALIWVLLLPSTRQKIAPSRGSQDEVAALMSSADPRVRALAAEVAGYRPNGSKYAEMLIDRLDDADPSVRGRAHGSLVRLFGTDAGTSSEAWRNVAKDRQK